MARQKIPHKHYSEGQFLDLSKQIGRSVRTLRRWRSQGCDLEDPESVAKFLREKEFLLPPVKRLHGIGKPGPSLQQASPIPPQSNGELSPVGRRGAAAALERLESQEERAHARLELALKQGDAFQIQNAQEYWLKCSETLRRLDLAIEISRRSEEEQIAKRKAEEAVLFAAEWFRISFMQFLSSESTAILGIKEIGELKSYIVERFKGILHLTVKNAAKTKSAV